MKKYLILLILPLLLSLSLPEDKKFPVPEKTKERLFYIQRNLNTNTIMYDAVFDNNGYLIKRKPIKVYYVNYSSDMSTRSLNRLERMFAYGIKTSRIKDSKNDYKIKLIAYKNKNIVLKQIAPYKTEVHIEINGKNAILDHIFIFADNDRMWPQVKYIELFGVDKEDQSDLYEKIIIND